MSTKGKRRVEHEVPLEETSAKQEARKNRHRSAYPTPGFKAFAAVLNMLSLPIAALLFNEAATLQAGVLLLCALAGTGVALYSNVMRPLATNVVQRKLLTGLSAVFGFIVLVSTGLTYLI